MYVYCVCCVANRCISIERILKAITPYTVIRPRFAQRQWKQGVPMEVERELLPGYLFLYSEKPMEQPLTLLRLNGVIRLLTYGRDEQGSLRLELMGEDLDFAMRMYQCGGMINAVKVYQVGERLQLTSGLLEGMEGEIIKVDRQRKRLQMKFTFDRTERTLWIGYDVIEAPVEGINLPKDAI